MSGPHVEGRWDPFRELQREVGRLIVSLDPFQSVRRMQGYPPLNVYDAGDRYLMSVQLPGMTAAMMTMSLSATTRPRSSRWRR